MPSMPPSPEHAAESGTPTTPVYTRTRPDGAEVSDDRTRLDFDTVHGYLTRSYWSPGITRDRVERAAGLSHPFGLYLDGAPVGYARVITDHTTFAYLADVFVLEEHQRRGLGDFLVESILAHPDLQGLRRWVLVTRDAHPLYARHGFEPLAAPDQYMERRASPPAPPEPGR